MVDPSDDVNPNARVSDEKGALAVAELLAKAMGCEVIVCFMNGEKVRVQPISHPQKPADLP